MDEHERRPDGIAVPFQPPAQLRPVVLEEAISGIAFVRRCVRRLHFQNCALSEIPGTRAICDEISALTRWSIGSRSSRSDARVVRLE